jgi:hypothetical protein
MGDANAPPRVRRRKWDEEAEPVQVPTARVNKWDQPAVPCGGGVSAALVARTQQGAAAIVEKINQVRMGRFGALLSLREPLTHWVRPWRRSGSCWRAADGV